MKTTRTIGSRTWEQGFGATCAVTLILAAATADDATELDVAPFSRGGWGFHVGGEFPGAAEKVETIEDEQGRQILRLHYDFSAGGAYLGGVGPVPKTGRIQALLLNVNAPLQTNIMVRFFDKTGQVFQNARWTEQGGWQAMRLDIDSSWETVFGGSGSKRVHWPIQRVMLSVRINVVEQGVIEFTDLRVISSPPTPEQMRVEQRQIGFTEQLRAWRHAWLDCLQSAAGVEQVLDRSILLASYGQLSNQAMQPKLRRQLEHLWQQMRDVERQWDEANLAVGRAENDAQLDEAIEQASGAEASLAMTRLAAGALLAEAGDVLGGKWLALERPQARQWMPARDAPAQFASQWHHIVSHVPKAYIEDHVLRPREFANVMVESLEPMLKRDGTLNESSSDYIEKFNATAADQGFAVVPNFHNIGSVAARGPQLPQWFIDEHGEEHAVIRTEPEHGLRTPNYWYQPSVDVIVEAIGKCAAHFEGDHRVLAFEYENEAMMYRFITAHPVLA